MKSSLDALLFISTSPMSPTYGRKKCCKKLNIFEKKRKKVKIFVKIVIFLEKKALNRGIGLFSAVCKPH